MSRYTIVYRNGQTRTGTALGSTESVYRDLVATQGQISRLNVTEADSEGWPTSSEDPH